MIGLNVIAAGHSSSQRNTYTYYCAMKMRLFVQWDHLNISVHLLNES